MKKIYCCLAIVILLSCNNDVGTEKPNGRDQGSDTSFTDIPKYVNPGVKPFTGRPDNDDEENRARREIIYMSIDSAYYAIRAIEEIKNELGGASTVNLTVPERNLKSKAILKMNIIQNALARRIDSALLANLKIHTSELNVINNSISADVTHLRNMSQQLNKVSAIMSRLTDVLSLCISKGLVKPPTPVNVNPEVLKGTVN